jgi:hypothetical protein
MAKRNSDATICDIPALDFRLDLAGEPCTEGTLEVSERDHYHWSSREAFGRRPFYRDRLRGESQLGTARNTTG